MKAAWENVLCAAHKVCNGPEEAVRITNLCILAARAFNLGLAGEPNEKTWSAAALRTTLERIALSPLPRVTDSARAWSRLAQLAQRASLYIETISNSDEWVAVFQSANFRRRQKTAGAYATPTPYAKWLACLTLRPFIGTRVVPRVVDPSAGTGALLIAAVRILGEGSGKRELRSIVYKIHGVESDPMSRELCCLLLWITAARANPDLKRIAENVIVDNAITRDWWSPQSTIFDALIMNPPWESLRHTVSHSGPEAKSRIETIARLSRQEVVSPDLPPLYSAHGKGDKNLFKAFVELAPHLLRHGGRIGALIPAAFGSDLGMAQLRAGYFDQFKLESWTGFENLRRSFPIDSRYKFGILIGTRSPAGTKSIAVRSFATQPHELEARHVTLTKPMIRRLGGKSLMIPELRDKVEAQILSRMFECGSRLFESGCMGPVRYRREVDLTLGRVARKFYRLEEIGGLRRDEVGRFLSREGSVLVPLIEGRMVGRFDVFQKSWVRGSGRTAQWEMNGLRPLRACTPQFLTDPRDSDRCRVAICDVTSATNTRTVHAALVPESWVCGNTAPVLIFNTERLTLAGLGVLNSLIFDWMARRIVGGLHLNKFYLATLVWPYFDDAAVSRLSRLAAIMVEQYKRMPMYVSEWSCPMEADDLGSRPETCGLVEAEIEREVAMGFRLERKMLSRIFSNDRNDRRGFWRYFSAHPASMHAVRNMLDSYEQEGSPASVSAVA